MLEMDLVYAHPTHPFASEMFLHLNTPDGGFAEFMSRHSSFEGSPILQEGKVVITMGDS